MFGLFGNRENPDQAPGEEKVKYDFENVEPFIHYLKEMTGISFDSQQSILKSKLTSYCRTHGMTSFDRCLQQVEKDDETKQSLINYLTTNESFFYREFSQIEKLVNEIKATRIKQSILCLPCSTGEEPYSIAIALLEAGLGSSNFDLVGVDISTEAIQRARLAVYNERNVSKIPPMLVSKYFQQDGKKFRLNEAVKSLVQFKTGNLFSNTISQLGKFDYVLSRNMLIYFDADTKLRASAILSGLLRDPGKPVLYGHADLY